MNIKNKTKIVKLSEIKPYKHNVKKHPEHQINQLKDSIEKHDYIQPIVVDGNNIIVIGHGRYEAIKQINPDEKIEVVDVSYLKPKEIKKLRILDNKIVSLEYDNDLMQKEIEAIYGSFDDLEKIASEVGISEKELNDIAPEVETNGDDDIPESAEPITKLGDLWELGEHRVLCGDSTKKEDVDRLMNGTYPDLIHTDPPYGMNAVSKSGVLSKRYKDDIIGDNDTTIAKDSFKLINGMFPESKQIWWGANYYSSVLPDSECWLVWDKDNGGSDQTDCELAWANFRSVVRQFTKSSEKKHRIHPTQKPVSLMEWIMKRFKLSSNSVADFFGGSGSTLIGAEKNNIKSCIMEFDTKYCDIIRDRYIKWCEDNNKTPEVKLNGKKWIAVDKGV